MLIDVPPRRRHVISLTPLIDVVFILLVFFMLASSFTQWRSLDLQLAGGGPAPDTAPARLELLADGGWQLDGQPVADAPELLGALGPAAGGVAVIVHPGVPAQDSVDILALLRRHGIERVALRAAGAP